MKRTILTLTALVLFAILPADARATPATSPLAEESQPQSMRDPEALSLADRDQLPALVPTGPSAQVQIPTLNVRRGPGTSYPVLTTVAQNTRLPVLGQVNNCAWLKVQTPAGAGWVASTTQYVTLSVSCATLPTIEILKPVFHTSVGDVTLHESSLTKRWPLGCADADSECHQVVPGYGILYVYFIPEDGDAADIYEAWISLSDSVSLVASDGTRTVRWAAGFDYERLILNFIVPVKDRNFKLCFPGEPCLPVGR